MKSPISSGGNVGSSSIDYTFYNDLAGILTGIIFMIELVVFMFRRNKRESKVCYVESAFSLTNHLAAQIFASMNVQQRNYMDFHQKYGLIKVDPNDKMQFYGMVAAVWVVQEFFFYVLHVAAHNVPLFWSFHKSHHSAEHVNSSTSMRNGMMYIVLMDLCGQYIDVFFMSNDVHLVVVYIFIFYQIITHMNTSMLPALPKCIEWVFVTPSVHRVHHGRNAYCINKNFGATLTIFDRLFGTFAEERQDEPIHFGLVEKGSSDDPFYTELCDHINVFSVAMKQDGIWNKVKALFVFPDTKMQPTVDQTILMAETERRIGIPPSKHVLGILPAGYKDYGQWAMNALYAYAFVQAAMLGCVSLLSRPYLMEEQGKMLWMSHFLISFVLINACLDQRVTHVAFIEVLKSSVVLGLYLNTATSRSLTLCFGTWPMYTMLVDAAIVSLLIWVPFLFYVHMPRAAAGKKVV